MQAVTPPLAPRTRAQVDQVARALERYRDIEVAKREGWRSFGGDEPLMGQHWSPPEDYGADYQGSDARLDFARPNNLMYSKIDGEWVLTGAAFVVRIGADEVVPEGFYGRMDNWHIHDMQAAWAAATEERPILRWLGNRWLKDGWLKDGENGRARTAMVHVWAALPNPDGVFADYNRTIPLLKHGLDLGHARHLSKEAALGLDLAAEDGCENAYGGKLWVADTKRRQKRAIMRACKAEAQRVAAALEGDRQHPHRLFAEAEAAYRRVNAVFERELTPAQRRRIAMMSEHGDHGEGHDGHGNEQQDEHQNQHGEH